MDLDGKLMVGHEDEGWTLHETYERAVDWANDLVRKGVWPVHILRPVARIDMADPVVTHADPPGKQARQDQQAEADDASLPEIVALTTDSRPCMIDALQEGGGRYMVKVRDVFLANGATAGLVGRPFRSFWEATAFMAHLGRLPKRPRLRFDADTADRMRPENAPRDFEP